MEIQEVASVGKSHQSMESKNTCILVVNDDLTCNNIVAEMLQHCTHQVLHIGGVLDVLNAIWESKEGLDLVLTNAHKLESNGVEIVRHIQKKLNLPIILMCPDKMKIVSKGDAYTFAAYVLKGLGKDDVNNLWQCALQKEMIRLSCTQEEEDHDHCAARSPSTANINVVDTCLSARKRKARETSEERRSTEERKEEYHHHHPQGKKPRVVWTIEMHQKFLEAIEILGYDKAVPKKIVEVMGIPGLTRENVASHLQKFRGSIRRNQEAKQLDAIRAIPSSHTSRNTYVSTVSLGTTPETDHYMFRGGLRFSNGFRTYGDHLMKNVTTNMNKTTSFVGYRLTSDGNSIEYGNNIEAKSCNDQETASIQTLEEAALLQNPSGKDTPSSSVLPRVQEFSIPPLETTHGDYPADRNLEEGLPQGHSSSPPPQVMQYLDDLLEQDDDMVEGTSSYLFEWEEFDDTFFKSYD